MSELDQADDSCVAQSEGRGRKVRTSDCRHCRLMRSLRAANMPGATVQAICDRMWLNRVRRRQVLYDEGNRAAHLFAVRSGRVKLLKIDRSGREHLTAIHETGDLFGFEAVFDTAYATRAEALDDSELCLASGQELKALMASVPSVAVDLARYLHQQLVRTQQRQVCLGALSASARLAGFLLQDLPEDADAGEHAVARGLTLRDLGGILGLSPETVCRTRSQFAARGLIEPLASGIRLRNVRCLEELAGA